MRLQRAIAGWVLLWLVACGQHAPATAPPPVSGDDASLRAFIETVYAPYVRPAVQAIPQGNRMFSAQLAELIEQDRVAAAGEVGTLDHDPLCACQDFRNFVLGPLDIARSGDAAAKVKVSFTNDGAASAVELSLQRQPQGSAWVIADIGEPGIPSVVALLEAAKRQRAAP